MSTSKYIICEPLNNESCAPLLETYQKAVRNKDPQEDIDRYKENVGQCLEALRSQANFYCRTSEDKPIVSSAKWVNGQPIPEDCRWSVSATGCKYNTADLYNAPGPNINVTGKEVQNIIVTKQAVNGGSCAFSGNQTLLSNNTCSVNCQYSNWEYANQSTLNQIRQEQETQVNSCSSSTREAMQAAFESGAQINLDIGRCFQLSNEYDAKYNDALITNCKLDPSSSDPANPKWTRTITRYRVGGDTDNCPSSVSKEEMCPSSECIYNDQWTDPGLSSCSYDATRNKWYRTLYSPSVSGLFCMPLLKEEECKAQDAKCTTLEDSLYDIRPDLISGDDIVPVDCDINVAQDDIGCSSNENGTFSRTYRACIKQQPRNPGSKSCEQVVKEKYGFEDPIIYGPNPENDWFVKERSGMFTDQSMCDGTAFSNLFNDPYGALTGYRDPAYQYPNCSEGYRYPSQKESFALPSTMYSSPIGLPTSAYYRIGDLKSGAKVQTLSPSSFGGPNCPDPGFVPRVYAQIASIGVTSSLPATSPQQILNSGNNLDGFYWYRASGMSSAVRLYTRFRGNPDNKGWVLVFSSPYNGTATVNEMNKNIPFTGVMFQIRNDLNNQYYSYFSTNQLFNTRNSTATTTGGNRAGYKVFLGYAGGHGFYNTGQTGVCNWGSAAGAVGAGFDGANCGSFPNGLKWGFGVSTSSVYTPTTSTVWETWVSWS